MYFHESSTKYISTTGQTTIQHSDFCVDGKGHEGTISLYNNGTHGDDFANDGVYVSVFIRVCLRLRALLV